MDPYRKTLPMVQPPAAWAVCKWCRHIEWSVGYGDAVLLFTIVFSVAPPEMAWRYLFFLVLLPALFVLWIRRYVEEWHADALVIHSVKSCRLFSAGQGDMREYFTKDLNVPTLLIESDIEDPRYFSEAQLKNRIDAFFESLEHKKLTRRGAEAGGAA